MHAAVHVAHGDVVDSISCKLQHCTKESETRGGGISAVPLPESQIPAEVSLKQQSQHPAPSAPGPPFPPSTPGYGKNTHEPHVAGKAGGCLILKDPVSDASCEEGNGHFPCGERGDASVTNVITHDFCPSAFSLPRKLSSPTPACSATSNFSRAA